LSLQAENVKRRRTRTPSPFPPLVYDIYVWFTTYTTV